MYKIENVSGRKSQYASAWTAFQAIAKRMDWDNYMWAGPFESDGRRWYELHPMTPSSTPRRATRNRKQNARAPRVVLVSNG